LCIEIISIWYCSPDVTYGKQVLGGEIKVTRITTENTKSLMSKANNRGGQAGMAQWESRSNGMIRTIFTSRLLTNHRAQLLTRNFQLGSNQLSQLIMQTLTEIFTFFLLGGAVIV
jgi:hypothetical protein